MDLKLMLSFLTFVEYLSFTRFWDYVAMLVKDLAFAAVVLEKPRNDRLLQNFFIFECWLDKNPSIKLEV